MITNCTQTEYEAFIAMLKRADVKHAPSPDADPGCTSVYIPGGQAGVVRSFGHCFCEFNFNQDGELVRVSFGY